MTAEGIRSFLFKARKNQGMTLRALTKRLGRQYHGAIDNWESGHRDVKLTNLVKWANSLGFDVVLRPKMENDNGE